MALKFLNNGYFAGKVGIGTESPDRKLHVKDSAIVVSEFEGTNAGSLMDLVNSNSSQLYNGIRFTQGTTSKMAITHIADGTTKGYIQIGNSWATGSEILVVDGRTSNVGIGTTSPQAKLHVQDSSISPSSVYGTLIVEQSNESSIGILGTTYSSVYFGDAQAPYTGGIVYKHSDNHLEFRTNGNSEKMRITSGGNVGIGTITPDSKLDVTGGDITVNTSGVGFMNFKYGSVGSESTMGSIQTTGIDLKINATSDLLLLPGSNVGIGTTSPNAKLDVQSSTTGNLLARVYNPNTGTSSSAAFRIASSANNANSASLQFSDSTAYTATISGDRVQGLVFRTSASGSNPITIPERMRITPTGNVGIGTTSPSSKLEVNGDIDTTGSNGYLINGMAWALENSGVLTLGDWDGNEFSTRIMDENSNEVLRVTGGRVGIGTTSPLATLHIDNPQTANGNIGMISDASAGGTGTRNIHVNLPNYGEGIRFLRSGTYSGGAMKFYSGSSNVGSVQINASSTSFNTTSDYRAKENIVAMENSINRLKELKPCRFNFLIDPENTVDGFIAHEAQEVVPEAITGEKDKLDYEGNPEYQGIDQSKLVPLLTSALQEAINKIEQLETRIQTLENN